MSLSLETTKGNVNLVSAYAPTLGASPHVKDYFYEALADTLRLMNTELNRFSFLESSTHVLKISGREP